MKSGGLVAVPDRGGDGAPILDEAEGESFAMLQPFVGIVLGDSDAQESGTLYITTRRLVWLSDRDISKGYAVDFLSLSMHAISRDLEAYPSPCVYCQIENGDDEYCEDDEDEEEDEVANGDANLSKIREMRLVPQDPAVLDNIFQVLCECAALNPDPQGEREGEGEWFFNAEEVMASENLERGMEGLEVQDSRFEDAEEDPEDE
ncbi:hypothetical protein SELMODRAFT_439246 [Selaginella moellendorffii]|uniref:Chloride conductance regulatory protein ICln n=1 Tax=Selaginella moellendorffii TaxID=88036 RepID=D8R326_SELML|nr:chloride conductance regulatory protein ICln [Selaginella moellendorffii]EFJ33206.1 hypothetical protein SELMODRAFT_439246 [Selaginella moellendorffii]|eukprot:XP_002965786.1 chloride conductance regulatory protein ICln [Selaginella moellendorffii]